MPGPSAPQYYTLKKQVPLSQGQTLGFKPGSGYYARGIAQAAASDPYGQLTGYVPLTPAQIQAQAQGEIAPILKAITGQANDQATQQAAQIKALTSDYANELGQINMAAPYQSAEPQQAAVDAALQQSLTGEGASLAGGLSDRLAALQGSSGAGALQQAANDLSSQGASNGTTELANGSAALSNLIANAAAGGEFGLKQPLIAKLSGLQALGESGSQQQQNAANATLQAESQLPSIIQDLTANNQSALSNAVSAEQKAQALAIDQAVKDATLGQGEQKIKIAQQNANTAAARAAATAAYQQMEAQLRQEGITAANTRAANALKAKMAQGARPDPALSKEYGYIVDATGKPILDAKGKRIPVKSTSKSSSKSGAVPPWGK